MTARDEIVARITDAIQLIRPIDPAALSHDKPLLGQRIDSLDLIDLGMAIEEQFGVDVVMSDHVTVEDIADAVIAAQPPSNNTGKRDMAKTGPITADRLKSFIERIERLEEERAAISGDVRDVYAEAKGVGYDVKTMRKVVQIRKLDAAERAEQEALLDVYLHALGMVDRIEARAAAGESAREIAKAEGVSKSTAHRVSQKAQAQNDSAEMGQASAGDTADDGLDIPPHLDRRVAAEA